MAQFRIFIDNENYLAIAGFPDDRTNEEIRVTHISAPDINHTIFVLRNSHRIDVQMALGEIVLKLSTASGSHGLDIEGAEYA